MFSCLGTMILEADRRVFTLSTSHYHHIRYNIKDKNDDDIRFIMWKMYFFSKLLASLIIIS